MANVMGAWESNQPQDRLTRLSDEMLGPLSRGENDDVKGIVFLVDEKRGGIGMHGYDTSSDAMTDLLVHVKAVFEANGWTLDFMAIDEDGVHRA